MIPPYLFGFDGERWDVSFDLVPCQITEKNSEPRVVTAVYLQAPSEDAIVEIGGLPWWVTLDKWRVNNPMWARPVAYLREGPHGWMMVQDFERAKCGDLNKRWVPRCRKCAAHRAGATALCPANKIVQPFDGPQPELLPA